jgi:hypothetical protein
MKHIGNHSDHFNRSIVAAFTIGLLVVLTPTDAIAQARQPITLKKIIGVLNRCNKAKGGCKLKPDFVIGLVSDPAICLRIVPGDIEAIGRASKFLGPKSDDFIAAIKTGDCALIDANKLARDSERVRISLLNSNCNDYQRDKVVGPLSRALHVLPNRFQGMVPSELYQHVLKLKPIPENLKSALSVEEIETYLDKTHSLVGLLFECPEKPTSDKPSYLTSQWFLGKLRGELETTITVKTRFEYVDYEDENGLHNLLALYALARDAQINGQALSALGYLREAYTSATCKINDFGDQENHQREVFDDSKAKAMESKQKESRDALDEIQKGRKDVLKIRDAIRKTLAKSGTEPPIPKCPDQ